GLDHRDEVRCDVQDALGRHAQRRARHHGDHGVAMTRNLLIVLALASCTSNDISYIPGFSPPAAAQGYERFVTPTVTELKPGDNVMYCQWIAAPEDADRQIVDTTGFQSLGGHHVALYATSSIEEVGTSRP